MFLEGYTFSEAFYMTVITVSTVGFHEIRPLSPEGRWFTATLIFLSFGTFAYAISSITKYIISGQYKIYLQHIRINREVKKMKDHVIVCGYGRNGRQAIKTLKAHKKTFVIVEKDDVNIEKIKADNNLYVKGDATDEEVLLQAGIKHANSIITTLPKDSDNVFVVLTSRELNAHIRIISRASIESSESKLKIAGANNVIMPDRVGGSHMASLVVTPDVYEFLDRISVMGSNEVNLEEIDFSNIPDKFHYKTLNELDKSYHTGCLIIGYKDIEGAYSVNPSGDYKIVPGSKIFVLGTSEQVNSLNEIFEISTTRVTH